MIQDIGGRQFWQIAGDFRRFALIFLLKISFQLHIMFQKLVANELSWSDSTRTGAYSKLPIHDQYSVTTNHCLHVAAP